MNLEERIETNRQFEKISLRKVSSYTTDGAGYVPLEQLRQLPEAVIAFDRDQTGEMAQQLMQDLPQARRYPPTQKDWNEDLQTHVRQLQQRLQEELLKQDQQREQKGHGLEL